MSFKVAVASSDGKYINQHFGWAQQFLIFEIDDNGEYKFLEPQKPMVFGPSKFVEFRGIENFYKNFRMFRKCNQNQRF